MGMNPEDFEKNQALLHKEEMQSFAKNRNEEEKKKNEAPLSCSLDGKCE